MTDWLRRAACATLAVGMLSWALAAPAIAEPRHDALAPAGVSVRMDQRALELQQKVQHTEAAYQQARERLSYRTEHLNTLTLQAKRSAAAADTLYRQVRDRHDSVLGAVSNWVFGEDAELEQATDAVLAAQHMQELVALSRASVEAAEAEVSKTRAAADQAAADVADLSAAAAAHAAAALARQQSAFAPTYHASTASQDHRNRRALDSWRNYLFSLAKASVVPPPAAQLNERGGRTDGIRPATSRTGRRLPGVAQVRGADGSLVTVLPAETIRAVSAAFSTMGADRDYEPCGGFTSQVWGAARLDLPTDDAAQWQQGTRVARGQLTLGDTVFFTEGDGYRTGVYVGHGKAISYDADTGEVAVVAVPGHERLGQRRVIVPADAAAAPAPVPAVITEGCRPPVDMADPAPAVRPAVRDGWAMPLADGAYTLSAGFGDGGTLWSSGSHTGQDFAAPIGTPVFAARGGVVTVEESSWAGHLVRVDHGDGLETWYAHMSRIDVSTGQTVARGDVLGAVGTEGNSTGPHLHFEVHLGGAAVDPMPFLAGTR